MTRKNRRYKSKRYKAVLGLICGIVLFMSYGTRNVYAYENTIGIVKDGGARIRSSASTDGSVLASVVSGDRVEICGVETASDGYTWYKVYVNGNTIGYIRGDLLTDTGEKTGSVTDNNATGNLSQEDPVQNADNPEQSEMQGDTPGDGQEDIQDQPVEPDNQGDEAPVGSAEAYLTALSIGDAAITPLFSPYITEYTVTVGEDITSVSAYGVASEGASVIENYGFTNLQKGSNMAVITVQAADGTTKSYYFTVNRGEASSEIHYSQPDAANTDTQEPVSTVEKGGSHTAVIVFLVIVILAMAAVLVLMGLRVRDYRRELYGEDPEEFHLRDALPENSVFSRKADKRQDVRKRRKSIEVNEETDDKEAYSGHVYETKDRMYENDSDGENVNIKSKIPNDFAMGEDGFLYDIRKVSEDSAQIQDPGMQYDGRMRESSYHGPDAETDLQAGEAYEDEEEGGVDTGIAPEDDELEDIMERNATITDQENGKEVWQSVNFMTPREDLEFEFLDLEDENE